MSNNNISFLLEEKYDEQDKEEEEFDFSNFVKEMDELTKDNTMVINYNNSELLYYVEKKCIC
jgi:hypothetical protein